MPMTAHFIGGCAIGDSPETGVVDPYQRVYGYDGLHVVDGSAVSANLGVNPSLTITAQAERAMAFWPNKGEADPRPELGAAYRRLAAGGAEEPGRAGGRAGGAAAADRRRQLIRRTSPQLARGRAVTTPSRRSLARVRGPAVMLPPKGRVSRLGSCSQWLGAKPQGSITLPPRSGPGAFPARSRPDPGPAAHVDRLGA